MSVTFTAPGAPQETKPCPFCLDWRERGWLGEGEHCDAYCDGTTSESAAPEVNMANANAIWMLRLLGWTHPDDYLGGSCAPAALRQRILRARNGDVSAATSAPYELAPGHAGMAVVTDDDGIPRIERRGPRVIGMGYTADDVLDRLDRLDRLAQWAQEKGLEVSWA